MAEPSGELLGGRYRLLGERTSFPFGAWWEAEDDQGARAVVLRMNPEVADPAAKAKAAVAAAARIDSPHVVAWADGGVDAKGQGWLAAPMFGPWSLTEHVTRGEGVPPAEAAPIMHQVARAVAAGEAAAVLHNTLTSEFVRLVPIPEGGYGVKVYGFGLADLLPSYKPLRKQDAYLGVPDYMSPELCAGKAAEGSSADVYALGILMYEAVRGRPPFAPTFASASASTTLKRHIFEKPLPLHVRFANAPFIKTYENICFKALAKTANRRHTTVAELEKELEQLIVEEMRSQVVSLTALSGRGPTTARRLRTQVIAQIPVDEAPKVEIKAAPKPEAPETKAPPAAAVASAPQPVRAAAAPVAAAAAPAAAAAAAPAASAPEPEPEEAAQRRTDSTLVFAGLGPAVREMAEAARKAEDEEEGSEEEAALPAGAVAGTGKRKKKRKGSSGVSVVPAPAAAPRAPAGAQLVTSPSAATIITPRAEVAAAQKEAIAASSAAEAPGARIRKKDDTTVVSPKERGVDAVKGKDEQEEWFTEEGGGKRASRAWILLLLAAAVVVVVVILLMSSSKDEENKPTQPPAAASTEARYQLTAESGAPTAPAPGASEAKPAAGVTVTDQGGLTAGAATQPPTEAAAPAKVETPPPAEPAKLEPAKLEAPPAEPPKVEAVKPEPAKVEAPMPVPAKVEAPKPAATKVEAPKVEAPKPEPAKVEAPKPEPKAETTPAKVETPEPVVTEPETPAKVDPAGSPEDQFRSQAKHYITLGLQAYKSENYKLAIGYFKKAQEADPTNALAAQYLKKAVEKSGAP